MLVQAALFCVPFAALVGLSPLLLYAAFTSIWMKNMELGLIIKSSADRHHNFVGIKLKAVSSDFDFDNSNNDDEL